MYYKSSNKEEIILDEDYVIAYKNGSFYYIQKIDKTQVLEKLLKILIDTLRFKNPIIIKNEDIKYKKRYLKEFIRPFRSYGLKLYLLYLFTLGSIFYLYDFSNEKYELNLKTIHNTTTKLQNDTKFYSISKRVANIYSVAKEMNIDILSIVLKESILALEITTLNKQNIYAFFKKIDYKSVENINYDEDSKRYQANGKIKIYRR
ncbi:hypothetical protein CRV08_02805 [Halarcobacter ebronensis]|uniref:Uncharacterized protein n=1 Tax=Halarcobacter ebronensis TaxID=1462615 RepID=A0A4Q0YGC5_9BACT|nr:hypothetical protein [Halarcobacter ebronensis]RXJ69650.1 hypothetical protein CRV08_02805 [Halarcobacter ebronensis]